jgi:hypothetical protein
MGGIGWLVALASDYQEFVEVARYAVSGVRYRDDGSVPSGHFLTQGPSNAVGVARIGSWRPPPATPPRDAGRMPPPPLYVRRRLAWVKVLVDFKLPLCQVLIESTYLHDVRLPHEHTHRVH